MVIDKERRSYWWRAAEEEGPALCFGESSRHMIHVIMAERHIRLKM